MINLILIYDKIEEEIHTKIHAHNIDQFLLIFEYSTVLRDKLPVIDKLILIIIIAFRFVEKSMSYALNVCRAHPRNVESKVNSIFI